MTPHEILLAVSALTGTFALAAVKIWTIMSSVNSQIRELLKESEDHRKQLRAMLLEMEQRARKAEAEAAALKIEIVNLRAELENLKKIIEKKGE